MSVGEKGWIFHESENIFQRLDSPIHLIDVEAWAAMHFHRIEFCKQICGAEYMMLVCPEKAVVYRHYLPDHLYHISDERPAIGLQPCLGERMIYPLSELQGGDRDTYGPSESHFNDYGAYLTYRALMARLSYVSDRSFTLVENPVFEELPGDGYCDIGPVTNRTTWVKKGVSASRTYDNGIWMRGNVKIYKNSTPGLPSLILFRDSFSNMLLPFLAESFSKIIAISSWGLMYDVLARVKADYVICEMAERYLTPVLYYEFPSLEDQCKLSLDNLMEYANA